MDLDTILFTSIPWDCSFFVRWGTGGIGEEHERKKKGFQGGASQQNKGKKGVYMKSFSKTLKWHNVSINEVLEFKRKK